jgi:hypothetical protein
LGIIEERSRREAEERGDAKLSPKDVYSKKAGRWATARSRQSAQNLSLADGALKNKFPGMMK